MSTGGRLVVQDGFPVSSGRLMADMKERAEEDRSPASPRVSFVTLGCRVNQSETAAMQSCVGSASAEDHPPEVIVVNGCTVTALADRKSRQLLRRARRRFPEAKLVLIGCLGDALAAGLVDSVDADLVAGNAWKESIQDVVALAMSGRKGQLPDPQEDPWSESRGLPDPLRYTAAHLRGRTRAFLKVQDGCDGVCTFCRTTQVRGASRSRPLHAVIVEAERLVAEGVQEIAAVGVDLASYRTAEGGLAELITGLGDVVGLRRVRFGSVNPGGITSDVIDAIGRSTIVCRHLHIPLQSGDDGVLARMLRPYTRVGYLEVVGRLRAALPQITLGTDLIVGFPGEHEDAFRQTCDLLDEVGFVNTHIFRYSPRQGTRAASLMDGIPPPVKRRRAAQLEALAMEVRRRALHSMVGTRQHVLLERKAGDRWRGYTGGYVDTRILPAPGLARGKIVSVHITAAEPDGLEGALLDD
jgi:threonylcarbamoyladenosine tRNA methylthiotransferase MtaB